MVCLNRLTGHSSGFFSVYTLPPNQATSAARQRKINEARGQVPPRRDVFAIILRKTKALLKAPLPPAFGGRRARMLTGPAERTPEIADASVDLIVTSPPFLDVVDYPTDNWLRCWFAGIDAETVPITLHRSLADWERFIASLLQRSSPASCGRAARSRSKWAKCAAESWRWSMRSCRPRQDLPLKPLAVDDQQPGLHQDRAMLGRRQQRQGHQQQPHRGVRAALAACGNVDVIGRQAVDGALPHGFVAGFQMADEQAAVEQRRRQAIGGEPGPYLRRARRDRSPGARRERDTPPATGRSTPAGRSRSPGWRRRARRRCRRR